MFHVLLLVNDFYIKISFTLYLPYLVVDLPFHVCKIRKNGKKYTNKDQAQACSRCTWQRNSSQAMGKLSLLRLSWIWGPLPPAQASVLNRNLQWLPTRFNLFYIVFNFYFYKSFSTFTAFYILTLVSLLIKFLYSPIKLLVLKLLILFGTTRSSLLWDVAPVPMAFPLFSYLLIYYSSLIPYIHI